MHVFTSVTSHDFEVNFTQIFDKLQKSQIQLLLDRKFHIFLMKFGIDISSDITPIEKCQTNKLLCCGTRILPNNNFGEIKNYINLSK